ncbi:MAG: phosphoribosylformylglycinamidine synthase subunit PurL [Chloroflexota bacterium]|nr:MAG: phosphoribosylformylglycinamidine synthase subunit PurL [Chloroflexota bacterium]
MVALSIDEYRLIVERLGRTPTGVEIGMFGSMWSEHCGYKNSKPLLRLFPTQAPWVLQGPGENAGVVDIGDGLAIAMKMESHNHPSAVEPHEGAATGVGGIIRDIFTMGARPIAILDALRFGPLDSARNRYLFQGVVGGISAYGNCIGVPTVGGDISFAECYRGNPLVNVMAVGLLRHDDLIRATATGAGDVLILVGSDTGRDGIHGASGLASRELSAEREEQRPTVQVGNPFIEKLLIEACLELLRDGRHHIVGLQDLGAAGITSAVVEVAAKSGTGVEIDVAKVARRESGMSAYEVMLSESQERMLVIARAGHESVVRAIFDKWELHSDVIGLVTSDGIVCVRDGDVVECEVPAKLFAEAPTHRRQGVRPIVLDRLASFDPESLAPEPDLNAALATLLAHPDVASKRSVYRQYDHTVQTNTLVAPGDGDAAVLRIKGTRRAVALSTDCTSRYCQLDPRAGGAIAVAEACRNVASSGARPIAITDCLNFGNPEKLEIYYQLEEAISGMADACRALSVPVISGNVSLYNETDGTPIYPTPMVGALGLIDDADSRLTAGFRAEGHVVAVVGSAEASLGGSLYLAAIHGVVAGRLPHFDAQAEAALHAFLVAAAGERLLMSCHDLSDGGFAVALAESAIIGRIGCNCDVVASDRRPEAILFSEGQSRAVVSFEAAALPALRDLATRHGVPFQTIGAVGGKNIRVNSWIDIAVDSAHDTWAYALERAAADVESRP